MSTSTSPRHGAPRRPEHRALCVLALVCASVVAAAPAQAATRPGVRVRIDTPRGVPATVVLSGGGVLRAASKPAAGARRAVALTLPARRYTVRARPFVFGGRSYAVTLSRSSVVVRARRTVGVTARVRLVPTARAVRATRVEQTALGLAWTPPRGARSILRRATGTKAPAKRTSGKAVAGKGATAVDTGLTAGTTYSYSIFTRVGRRWTGPVTFTAGTRPAPGGATPTYVTAPGAVLVPPSAVRTAATTGTGVRVALASGPPVVGTVLVLPISAGLPGGYLGRVAQVATDGTAVLTPASLDEAFDLYELDVPAFQDPVVPLSPVGATSGRASQSRQAANAFKACLGGSAGESITLKPSLGLGGHFKIKVDKFFGVPKSVALDTEFTVSAGLAVDADVSLSLKCAAPFKPVLRTLTTTPVPISFYFSPAVEAGVQGSATVQNAGVTATSGFRFDGSASLTGGLKIGGSPILSAAPTPSTGQIEGALTAKVGGEVVIGPGAGTAGAGVIAGVGGQLNPVDASVSAVFPKDDKRHGACLKADAAFTRELNLTIKAWLGSFDVSKTATFEFLKGRTGYFGPDAGYWPRNCEKLPATATATAPTPTADPPKPADDLAGNGVTVVDDETTGAPGQSGRVGGFVPGKDTFVLSTGRLADAIGEPGSFASTDLGGVGDDELSQLSGRPTHDAATYTVRVVPKGSKLKVQYVFASEEYPEFVGSDFNDVMRVLVDGRSCSFVPGTSDPVAVNTINANRNSAFYVDNADGATGYGTAMDGLTTPLTCEVPVTPGKEVTVKVAVADSQDPIYDSAVALVDKGISSE